MLIAILALLGAMQVEARNHRHDKGRRCHTDKVCHGGTCNEAGRCCTAGDLACGNTCCNGAQGQECCGDSYCTDLSDNANCGACGNTCTGGKTCENYDCRCPAGQTDCNGVCVDLTSNHDNCGTCGNKCDAAFSCTDSECRCSDSGLMPCNGECIDPYRDDENCGLCGRRCSEGEQCLSGNCQTGCPPCEEPVDKICVLKEPGKDTECNGTCVDLNNDPNNCGACGRACPPGGTCTNGDCGLCPQGLPVHYEECPVNDPGGHVIAACCRLPETPNCCFGSRGGGGCCTDEESCCLTNIGDGYCCPAGTQCCASSKFYPCLPPGAQCD